MADYYVHGYARSELQRLRDQSNTLRELLHHDTRFPPGSLVLEAGCGVGAQTAHILETSPGARIVPFDISFESLLEARETATRECSQVDFLQADLYTPPFKPGSFDHVFLCFVLEHLGDPAGVLRVVKDVLKPGGTLTAIEGDHGSCFFSPESPEARHVWNCLIESQARLGGDSLIGRRLYPLLHRAGFGNIDVSPRFVYADATRPGWVEGFTLKTICAMVEGVRENAIAMGLSDPARWETGMKALRNAAEPPSGVFCYTFFKATAVKSP